MKLTTFTYNQMIQFFLKYNLPLTEKQVSLIGVLHKEELRKFEEFRKLQRERNEKKTLKRLERKEVRRENLTGRKSAGEKN